MSQKLYVWADFVNSPVPLPLDHTWVSSYQPNENPPDASKGDYWYCWGDARNNAILLREGNGGIEFARNIAVPHNKNENVGIKYKIDGVCHQMANRILRFSLDGSGRPITVEGAKGYELSKAMYGIYGEKNSRTKEQKERLRKWEDAVVSYQKSKGK
jgi:hypothetical protein